MRLFLLALLSGVAMAYPSKSTSSSACKRDYGSLTRIMSSSLSESQNVDGKLEISADCWEAGMTYTVRAGSSTMKGGQVMWLTGAKFVDGGWDGVGCDMTRAQKRNKNAIEYAFVPDAMDGDITVQAVYADNKTSMSRTVEYRIPMCEMKKVECSWMIPENYLGMGNAEHQAERNNEGDGVEMQCMKGFNGYMVFHCQMNSAGEGEWKYNRIAGVASGDGQCMDECATVDCMGSPECPEGENARYVAPADGECCGSYTCEGGMGYCYLSMDNYLANTDVNQCEKANQWKSKGDCEEFGCTWGWMKPGEGKCTIGPDGINMGSSPGRCTMMDEKSCNGMASNMGCRWWEATVDPCKAGWCGQNDLGKQVQWPCEKNDAGMCMEQKVYCDWQMSSDCDPDKESSEVESKGCGSYTDYESCYADKKNELLCEWVDEPATDDNGEVDYDLPWVASCIEKIPGCDFWCGMECYPPGGCDRNQLGWDAQWPCEENDADSCMDQKLYCQWTERTEYCGVCDEKMKGGEHQQCGKCSWVDEACGPEIVCDACQETKQECDHATYVKPDETMPCSCGWWDNTDCGWDNNGWCEQNNVGIQLDWECKGLEYDGCTEKKNKPYCDWTADVQMDGWCARNDEGEKLGWDCKPRDYDDCMMNKLYCEWQPNEIVCDACPDTNAECSHATYVKPDENTDCSCGWWDNADCAGMGTGDQGWCDQNELGTKMNWECKELGFNDCMMSDNSPYCEWQSCGDSCPYTEAGCDHATYVKPEGGHCTCGYWDNTACESMIECPSTAQHFCTMPGRDPTKSFECDGQCDPARTDLDEGACAACWEWMCFTGTNRNGACSGCSYCEDMASEEDTCDENPWKGKGLKKAKKAVKKLAKAVKKLKKKVKKFKKQIKKGKKLSEEEIAELEGKLEDAKADQKKKQAGVDEKNWFVKNCDNF